MKTRSMKLQSYLIHAHDPISLRSWYQSVVGGEMVGDFGLVFEHFYLAFDGHDDLSAMAPEPHRAMLGFEVDDLAAEKARLDEVGVEWIREPTPFPLGLTSTIRDPEGNYVQVGQMDIDPIAGTH